MGIRVENIHKSFGNFTALGDVSLDFPRGELVAVGSVAHSARQGHGENKRPAERLEFHGDLPSYVGARSGAECRVPWG